MQLTPINELTNKAVLGIATAIGAALLAILGTALLAGAQALIDARYAQKIELYDSQIEYFDRRAFEIDQTFMMAGEGMDPATARRLGADKAWYENQKTIVLRRRADARR